MTLSQWEISEEIKNRQLDFNCSKLLFLERYNATNVSSNGIFPVLCSKLMPSMGKSGEISVGHHLSNVNGHLYQSLKFSGFTKNTGDQFEECVFHVIFVFSNLRNDQ